MREIQKPLDPESERQKRRVRVGVLVVTALVILAVAGMVDRRVAEWMVEGKRYGVVKWAWWAPVAKFPGTVVFTIAMAVVVMIRRDWPRWGEMELATSAVMAGLMYWVAKWLVGRTRPVKGVNPFGFEPFHGGWRGLFVAENQSFPSGHTCIAFATAAVMAQLMPRYGWAFYVIAGMVGVERVAESAHYPSDVVAGAILGILAAMLARMVVDRYGPPALTAASHNSGTKVPHSGE